MEVTRLMRVEPFNGQSMAPRKVGNHAKFAMRVAMRMIECVMFEFQYPQSANVITRHCTVCNEHR